MRPELAGLVHGAAEHLPVSSSAHLLALGADHPTAVAAHLGSAVVTTGLWWRRPRPALQAAALLPPVLVGGLLPAVGRRSVVAGLVAGSAALLVPARGGRDAAAATWRDGLALGAAQACALWPGVSRMGATAAAARLRGFAPGAALALAREVAAPVTLAAVVREVRDVGAARVVLACVVWRLALAAYLRRR
jgi:undecaprenyl-diphosphatase